MQPVPTHDPAMDRGWGVTGFDREIGVCLRVAESDEFLKTSKLLLSPIQVADLQPAYALVA